MQCQKQSQEQIEFVNKLKQIRDILQSKLQSLQSQLIDVQSDHCGFKKDLTEKLSYLNLQGKYISVIC